MTDLEFVTHLGNSLVISGFWVPGQVIHMTWTGTTVDVPCRSPYYNAGLGDSVDTPNVQGFSSSQLSGSLTLTITQVTSSIDFVAYTDSYCSTGRLHGFEWHVDPPPSGYCQYGTRLKGTTNAILQLTPEVIAGALAVAGLEFLSTLFVVFWYTNVNLQELCGSAPPDLPTIDTSTPTASAATVWQILQVVLWYQYCECTPGAGPVAPYPPPTVVEPPGWPTAPTFTCDPAMLCATLENIQHQLAALAQGNAITLGLVTLLQRYGLPFAYIRGATHSGLTGTGSFAVSRLVGLEIDIASIAGLKLLDGNPPYVWDVGWISVSDADGMIEERRPSREHLVWAPRLMATADHFNYFLEPGITLNVTELQAEP